MNKKRKKVLLIDPSDSLYSYKLSESVGKLVDLTVVSRYRTNIPGALKLFYRYSDKVNNKIIRKILRGMEYILTYIKILFLLNQEKYDVVHVQWALLAPVDCFFWKQIKKKKIKLVFTAHDPIPHTITKKSMKEDKNLYAIPDIIVVHSQISKKDILHYFPKCKATIYVQKHGVYDKRLLDQREVVERNKSLLDKIKDKGIILGFIGRIDYYKGVDLLVDAWKRIKEEYPKTFLLIIGETYPSYEDEFNQIENELKKETNVFVYNKKYTNEEEQFFYSLCDLIVLPYRTASASGVFFSAAQHEKAVLMTSVGSLSEYIKPAKDFIYTCEPSGESIFKVLSNILVKNNIKDTLKEKGIYFQNEYMRNFLGMVFRKD